MSSSTAEQRVLLYDPAKCTGCLFCQMACVYQHFKEIGLEKANLRIIYDEKTNEFEAIYCQHCDEPLCVAACPNEAAVKDETTGWVKINPLRCIGCKTCTVACPLSAPWFNVERRIAMKCDFCDGDPKCAKYCSPQAIRVALRKELWDFNRRYVGV